MFNCDFCRSMSGTIAYSVPESRQGMQIAVCDDCALVQSLSSGTRAPIRNVTTSSGADWGNIRHGKGLRLALAVPLLQEFVDWKNVDSVLDVGSNRGDFLLWLDKEHPGHSLIGIEPDPNIVDRYRALSNLTLHVKRFEDVTFPAEAIDFVYCSHTLEHAMSASKMLAGIRRVLRPGGLVFLEVPNVAVITDEQISEEFFIDKHSFHFSRELLLGFMRHCGLRSLFVSPISDISNITIVASRNSDNAMESQFSPDGRDEAMRTVDAIRTYERRLSYNRSLLKKIGDRLNTLMRRQRVAIWGGGRLFDALVRFGGLDASNVYLLIDSYLSEYLPDVHSVKLCRPEALRLREPQVLVVLARTSTEDIKRQAHRYGVNNIITFSELYQAV
jgi:hypothetical protein